MITEIVQTEVYLANKTMINSAIKKLNEKLRNISKIENLERKLVNQKVIYCSYIYIFKG